MLSNASHPGAKTLHRYRCGAIVYDQREPALTVGGVRIDVQPVPLAVLAVLLEHAGQVVSHRQFFDAVWPNQDISPQVLPNAIKKLRDALGTENRELIAAVPKAGYRFDARVETTIVGRRIEGQMDLAVGDPMPACQDFRAERRLDSSAGHDVWVAARRETGERHVFKFAMDTLHIEGLKREVTISQTLVRTLGPRDDIVPVIAWRLAEAPCFLESPFGGESLERWASDGDVLDSLSRAARLALFEGIARTVADAHGVGVLHGDLKPGNILVYAGDRGWHTRLVDFGSGRLLDTALPAALDVTAFGATTALDVGHRPLPATLMYAAPELFDGVHPLSVRTDVYALGLLLYQLIIGDFKRALQPGWQRDIDDPMLVDDIAHAADGDPTERLASVDALLTALRSHDRRRADAAAAAVATRAAARRPYAIALAVALAAGFVLSSALYFRAVVAQRSLEREVAVSESLNRFLTIDFISQADPSVTGRSDVTVAEAARAAAQRIDTTFETSAPAVRIALHGASQSALHGLKQVLPAIDEGNAVLRESRDGASLEPAVALRVRTDLAMDLAETNRLDEADHQLALASAGLDSSVLSSSALQRAYLAYARANVAGNRMDWERGLRDYREARRLIENEPSTPATFRDRVAFGIVATERALARWADAERDGRELERDQIARWGVGDVRTCRTAVAIASAQNGAERQGDALATIRPAIACLTQKLGPTSTRTLDAIGIEAAILFKSGRFQEAAARWTTIVEPYIATTGADSVSVVSARMNIASALRLGGDVRGAEEAYSTLLALVRSKYGADAPIVQTIRYHLAGVILAQRRTAGVDELLDGLREDVLARSQPQVDWDARLDMRRGELALEKRDRVQANVLMKRALRRFEETDSDAADALRAKMRKASLDLG